MRQYVHFVLHPSAHTVALMDGRPLVTTTICAVASTSADECAIAAEIGANAVITFSRLQHSAGCILGAGTLLHFVCFNRDKMPSFLDRVARVRYCALTMGRCG